MFFVFFCCALKYHAAANFFIGGRESFENGAVVFENVAVKACQDLATLAQSAAGGRGRESQRGGGG
jgi:hypothetical protein